MALLERLINVFRPARLRAEIEEELQYHIASRTAENLAAGMNPGAARADAQRRFGSASVALEQSYEAGIVVWAGTILQDLRYAVRMLFQNPSFTVVAVLALALGIGVNAAVFTAYRSIIARPLGARDPDRMVNLAFLRGSGAGVYTFSYPDYEAYRDSVRSFDGLIALSSEQMTLSHAGGIISKTSSAAGSMLGGWVSLSFVGNAESASVFVVSENYFRVLGIPLLHGRAFDSFSTQEILASPPVLISADYWEKRFASDPGIVGATVYLNDTRVTVVGVTPRDFVGTGLQVPDFWLPMSLLPQLHSDPRWLFDRERTFCRIFARLAPGASIDQARVAASLVYERLRKLHDPASDWAKHATALVWPGSPFPLPIRMYGALVFAVLLIMVAAAMVLVVACANVGSLQLARARARQSEMHTRLSLGAGRSRLIRQLLTESMLLGVIAGAAALLITWVLLRLAVVQASELLPQEFGTLYYDVTPDLRVFTYVSVVSLFAGILFGLFPAMESSRAALIGAVRSATASSRGRRIQDCLVAAQVALSLVLLIAGGLLIRSSIHALNAETGYAKSVIDLSVQFPDRSAYTAPRRAVLIDQLRARLEGLPGTAEVTSGRPPVEAGFRTIARSLDDAPVQTTIYYTFVQDNYFATLDISLLQGHAIEARGGGAEHSVILSQSAAARLWRGRNPIGRNLRLGPIDERVHNDSELRADGAAWQVVGVVRDTRAGGFDDDSRRVYLPLPTEQLTNQPLLIRTRIDPAAAIRDMGPVLSSVDPDLPATASSLEDMLRLSPQAASAATAAVIASSIGFFGLLLALMGIYGTVSYIVALRTREVGIRMAIGASRKQVLVLILRETTRPVIAGLLTGMFLAVGASRLLRGLLVGLSSVDAISFVGVSLLFLGVALAASYPPARRAMRVEPAVALRYE
jgi:predicted permease